MVRNRAYTWMIVVAVLAALTLAVAWRGWRNAPAATAGPATTTRPALDAVASGATGATDAMPAEDAPGPAVPDPEPLPPVDVPFRLTIDDLQRRARAGDPAARCRLAAEHAHCDDVRAALGSTTVFMERQQAHFANMAESDTKARVAARSARMADEQSRRLLEASAHCDGVPALSRADIVQHWRAAARSGSRPAMVQYALGNAFTLRDTLDVLPELQVYRGEAEAMARRAASRGSVTALAALAAAYRPGSKDAARNTLLAQAVDEDAVESLALYLLLQAGLPAEARDYTRETRHIVDDRVRRLQAALPPADQARAARRASELQADWGAADVDRLDDGLLLHGAMRGEFPREACTPALAEKML